ncbi:MAG: hypothetical protein L3J74_08200 [Bacteroidales bacterium]|nr:hypothetical protein [Bacteroidales bacterium]
MFVSVKEAVVLTGKSQTTIYRLCKKRSHTRYVKKKDNKYFIDKAYLLATYPSINKNIMENTENKAPITNTQNTKDDLIEFTVENKATDEEIGEKIIDDISEKITERFNQAENELLDINDNTNTVSWDTIIGVSVGLLLITGFILMLYYHSGN